MVTAQAMDSHVVAGSLLNAWRRGRIYFPEPRLGWAIHDVVRLAQVKPSVAAKIAYALLFVGLLPLGLTLSVKLTILIGAS